MSTEKPGPVDLGADCNGAALPGSPGGAREGGEDSGVEKRWAERAMLLCAHGNCRISLVVLGKSVS